MRISAARSGLKIIVSISCEYFVTLTNLAGMSTMLGLIVTMNGSQKEGRQWVIWKLTQNISRGGRWTLDTSHWRLDTNLPFPCNLQYTTFAQFSNYCCHCFYVFNWENKKFYIIKFNFLTLLILTVMLSITDWWFWLKYSWFTQTLQVATIMSTDSIVIVYDKESLL